MEIIKEGVKIDRLFKPFKGNFKGSSYDSLFPPPMRLDNAKICEQFRDFITDTIVNWVDTGVLAVWGRVGEGTSPHLVLPLTVEPSKPRLCHDERFLNLWIKDLPFKLDHLTDLPRYVLPGHFQTSFDDKNGYQHVLLHPSSRTFFGLQWNGVYFVFCTLPFGWKASAYIYHNLGLAVTSAARSFGVPVSQYIDDRHVGQLCRAPASSTLSPDRVLAVAAAYILCYLLAEAGYFVAIAKSQCVPSIVIRFLGFLCDSCRQAFLLPPDKKLKFSILREEILSSRCVGIKTLQRFAGKVVSFSLAIPGCKLYTRETFKAISRLHCSSRPFARVEGSLRTEVLYWRFLDDWKDCFPWRSELHVTVSLFSDASTRAWGAVLFRDGQKLVSRDYWPSDPSTDVNLLESRALLNALVSFKGHLSNSRVDVHIDNKVLKSALDNDGCRNSAINEVVKEIYRYSRDQNFSIQTFYVPSSSNPADEPSRKCSDLDCMLSVGAWLSLERLFGPHSFDLMSLDSNCQKDVYGNPLPHYTPWATPGSAGINVFANPLPAGHNIYVFPPFVLLGALLRYVVDQEFHGVFHDHCSGYSTKAILVGNHPGILSRSFSFGQQGFQFDPAFPLPAFSRMARSSSTVGPLGVPMCLLVNIFCLTVPLIPRSLDLGRPPGDLPHVYTLMTLMPTSARLVVRGNTLKSLLSLPRPLTMQRLLDFSKSLTMYSKPSLTRDRSQPLSKNFCIS